MNSNPSFDRLTPGVVITSPPAVLTDRHAGAVREVGGYTHPLFTDPEFVEHQSPFPSQPVPGAFTLFLLGGLAEQSGVFDETVVAMIGIDEVRFPHPALVGDVITLEMTSRSRRVVADGRRGIVELGWRALNQKEAEVLTCRVSMMFRLDGPRLDGPRLDGPKTASTPIGEDGPR